MEITATPSRGRGGPRAWARLLVATLLLVLVALLTPVALGLSWHVVTDRAMGDSPPRGSVVYGEVVPPEELAVGDVVTFRRPSQPVDGPWVTRRIMSVRDELLVTRGDGMAEVDPWQLAADAEPARMRFYVPLVGYPWLVGGPLIWAATALLVIGAAVVVGRRRRTTATSARGVGLRSASSPETPAALG